MSGGQKKIESMFAYIAVDPADNTEGIVSIRLGDQHLPLVGADMNRMRMLKPHARMVANESGATIKLVRFLTRDELEIFEPFRKGKQ